MYTELLSYHPYEMSDAVSGFEFINSAELKVLAPVLPVEADFSDNDLVAICTVAPCSLAPVTPAEADFNDSDTDNLNSLLPNLTPSIPGEADFLDTDTVISGDSSGLAPVSPSEATFDDIV